MTSEQIEAIRARLRSVEPERDEDDPPLRPWDVVSYEKDDIDHIGPIAAQKTWRGDGWESSYEVAVLDVKPEVAEFIANAPTDIAALLAALAERDAEIAALKEERNDLLGMVGDLSGPFR